MSTKAKLTRCEVSKARLIYPSRLMSLIALGSFWLATRRIRTMLWQEGTSAFLLLFEDPWLKEKSRIKKDIKKRSQLHYKKIGCSLLPHSHPRILPIPLLEVLRLNWRFSHLIELQGRLITAESEHFFNLLRYPVSNSKVWTRKCSLNQKSSLGPMQWMVVGLVVPGTAFWYGYWPWR